MYWDEEDLWHKCQLFVGYASQLDRTDILYALWMILALEMLARASLAAVHPSLLADIRNNDEQGDNLLYACGIETGREPVSVKAKTVFARCLKVIPGFGLPEQTFCNELMRSRNIFLHTGAVALDDLKIEDWLVRYYSVCKLLVSQQNRTLEDLFGEDQASAAEEMISAADDRLKKATLDLIAAARKAFENLSNEEKEERYQRSGNKKTSVSLRELIKSRHRHSRPVRCPACGEQCLVFGQSIEVSSTKLEGDDIVMNVAVMPTSLRCPVCELALESHSQLHAAGLGGQFTAKEIQDPIEFHDIDVSDYYEPEYDNE